ncbi:MAG: hypothetical protein HY900_15395 [Deltaproteobacteria bacterium]|nr:hypothetical protein [Deltaproteobacteria bacterium]
MRWSVGGRDHDSQDVTGVVVVDTDVAHAAGETQHPISRACREVLDTILGVCHRVAFDTRGSAEWKRHESGYALRWRAAMQSRGKVLRVAAPETSDLSHLVEETGLSPKRNRAVLKDLHLVETALAVDKAIVSMDEFVRAALGEIAPLIPCVGDVVWVNPAEEDDDAIGWLKAGARRDHRRLLGS